MHVPQYDGIQLTNATTACPYRLYHMGDITIQNLCQFRTTHKGKWRLLVRISLL